MTLSWITNIILYIHKYHTWRPAPQVSSNIQHKHHPKLMVHRFNQFSNCRDILQKPHLKSLLFISLCSKSYCNMHDNCLQNPRQRTIRLTMISFTNTSAPQDLTNIYINVTTPVINIFLKFFLELSWPSKHWQSECCYLPEMWSWCNLLSWIWNKIDWW